MVKVSVIIPVYNGMPYLPQTLESVLGQTMRDIEIIVINDGSLDGSLAYLESVEDSRLRVIDQPNQGLGFTLNRLLQEASADIIARIDQDDVCHNSRIEKQYAAMQEHGYDMLFCNVDKIGAAGSWHNRERQKEQAGEVVEIDSMRDGCFVHSSMMARRDVLLELGGYRKAFYPSDDWDLQLRVQEKGKIGLLQESLVQYRFHDQANTLSTFFIMQEHRRWAEACHDARIKGEAEPSLAAHQKHQSRQWLRQLNRKRKDYGKYYIRMAGQHYLTGKKLPMMGSMLLATCCMPIKTAMRVVKAVLS